MKFWLNRKYITSVLEILGAVFVFCSVVKALDYLYVQDADWNRILWHNFYEDEGKIENVYIGSSHVYFDINPTQLDSVNGQYNFNLASPAQRLNGSYYLLKEVGKNNPLSHVYLELYYVCSNIVDSEREVMDIGYHYNWDNTDYMRNSFNKLAYMLSIAGTERYIDIFLPFSRYRSNLDDWDYIAQTIGRKQEDSHLLYEHYFDLDNERGHYEYQKQGYLSSTRELWDIERLYQQSNILGKNPMGGKSEQYLRKIISYCQKRDISITLFVSPVNALELISTEHYDNYCNQVREIAREYNIAFYDFNLTKEEYLPIQDGKYFADHHHLNSAGANLFTSFFSIVVEGDSLENKKYFYSSYAEKLRLTSPAIYGLYYKDSGKERTYWIASNREDEMEYRISLMPSQSEPGGGYFAFGSAGFFCEQGV